LDAYSAYFRTILDSIKEAGNKIKQTAIIEGEMVAYNKARNEIDGEISRVYHSQAKERSRVLLHSATRRCNLSGTEIQDANSWEGKTSAQES
jgi:hypothetical protein